MSDLNYSSALPAITPKTLTAIVSEEKTNRDVDAADTVAEHIFHKMTPSTAVVTLLAVYFIPNEALVANDTNYATITVSRRALDGSAKTTVASVTTKVTGGSGNWTAKVPVALTVTSDIPTNHVLTWEITKTAAGVVVPSGVLFFRLNLGTVGESHDRPTESIIRLPSMRADTYVEADVTDILARIQYLNAYVGASFGTTYAHAITAVDQAYIGGVYVPTTDRIYMTPYGQSDVASWHFINGKTGNVGAYTHGFSTAIVDSAYRGDAVYSPTENRVYFPPFGPSSSITWGTVNPAWDANNLYNQFFCEFGGLLYAGSGRASGAAEVWSYPGTGSTWTEHTPGWAVQNTQARCAAAYDGKIYIGTYNATTGGQVWSFDGVSTWANVSTTTPPWGASRTYTNTMAVLGTTLYVGSGAGAGGTAAQVWSYTVADGWTDVSGGSPWGTNFFNIWGMTAWGTKLYVGLQIGAGTRAEVWSYDTVGGWVEVSGATPPWDTSNYGVLSLAVVAGKLYVGTLHGTGAAQVWSFDGVSTWANVSPAWGTSQRFCYGLCEYSGRLYAGTYNAGAAAAQVWCYNPTAGTWLQMSPGFASTNIYCAAICGFGEKLYAGAGGSTVAKVSSGGPTWHYLNCGDANATNGGVTAYLGGGSAVASAYQGAVYSPVQNRVYFVPTNQSIIPTWHYIDCATGETVGYTHGFGTSITESAYAGGVYSPRQNRIYFAPNGINQPDWHYVDCTTGNVVAYTHGATVAAGYPYVGAVYSPVQNRIYLVPMAQAAEANWHYIDCDTGLVVAYAHGTGLASTTAYYGGVYSPASNRIYFVPYGVATDATWHYVDCDTGAVVAYTHGLTVVANGYTHGVYSPTQNRVYFVPRFQADVANWHYIQELGTADLAPSLVISALFGGK